ncbi:TrbI/VirB10 family protein [Aquitalea palustris]|uniref:TrbI/VirB10 family protein n=1 Tax=Aquitalea palustris TaxID=2480983 RepID=UPI001CF0AB3D|nr:TrbI/VirB10 family protein [Aquitalea palustris]
MSAQDNNSRAESSDMNFDVAPQRSAGAVNGSLKGKPGGFKRLSPKVKNLVIGGGAILVGIIAISIMSIDNTPKPKSQAEQQAKDGPVEATTPKSVTGAPNGVPSAKNPATGPGVDPLNDPLHPDASAPAPGTSGAAAGQPGGAAAPGGTPVPNMGGTGATTAGPSWEEQQRQQTKSRRLESLRSAMEAPLSSSANGGSRDEDMKQVAAPTQLGGGVMPVNQQQPAGAGDDPNKQIRKEQFLKQAQDEAIKGYLPETLRKPISPYEIKAGWMIPAIMVGGMNSDLPGQLQAQVRENVYDTQSGRYVLIPSGSKLVGTYDSQIAFGQSRVLVVWTRVIFPDGSEQFLKGMPGADQAGYAGLTGDVDNHLWPMFRAAVFMSVITAGAQLSQPQTTNSGTTTGSSNPRPSDALIAALGQQLGQAGSQIIQRYLQVQPTITTQPGQRFNILVTQNIVFPHPWKR